MACPNEGLTTNYDASQNPIRWRNAAKISPNRLRVSGTSLSLDEGDYTKDEQGKRGISFGMSTFPDNNGTTTVTLTVPSQHRDTIQIGALGDDEDDLGHTHTLSLNSTNWYGPVHFQVRTADDDDAVDETATINYSASGGGLDSTGASGSITVNVDDRNTAAFVRNFPAGTPGLPICKSSSAEAQPLGTD